jgi:hypothetical protein
MFDRSDRTVLDMDSSESKVHGQQEGSAYNGHFETVCYHPLFLFNDHGDAETVGEERTESGRSVRKNVDGVVPRVTMLDAGRVFRCEIHTRGILTKTRSGWSRMRPIKGRQIGNVGQQQHRSNHEQAPSYRKSVARGSHRDCRDRLIRPGE